MRTIAKLAHVGSSGGRSPLLNAFDTMRRALGGDADRRALRPMQDVDGWSDQAEVAYHESRSASRFT